MIEYKAADEAGPWFVNFFVPYCVACANMISPPAGDVALTRLDHDK